MLAQLAQALRPTAAAPARTYSAAAKEVSATPLSPRDPRASRRVASLRVCRAAESTAFSPSLGGEWESFRCRLPDFPATANVCLFVRLRSGRLVPRCAPCRASPADCVVICLLFLRLRNPLLTTRFLKLFFSAFVRCKWWWILCDGDCCLLLTLIGNIWMAVAVQGNG